MSRSISFLLACGLFLLALPMVSLAPAAAAAAAAAADDDWPRWRGPADNGMARGDAPLSWSDKEHVAWKYAVPGKGHSSPVIWADKIFLTTAVPLAEAAPAPAPAEPPPAPGQRGRGGMRSGGAVGVDHKFVVLCLNRNTGKVIWEQVAKTAAPHE